MYYAQTGRPIYGRKDFFQEEFPDQLWLNIENFIKNLANLPFWKSVELSSTVFGGKSNYDFWKKIFSSLLYFNLNLLTGSIGDYFDTIWDEIFSEWRSIL